MLVFAWSEVPEIQSANEGRHKIPLSYQSTFGAQQRMIHSIAPRLAHASQLGHKHTIVYQQMIHALPGAPSQLHHHYSSSTSHLNQCMKVRSCPMIFALARHALEKVQCHQGCDALTIRWDLRS